MMKPPLVSVFELVNTTKKELVIWIGDADAELSPKYLAALRPVHWSAADQITARTIEPGLGLEAAQAIRDSYAAKMERALDWGVRLIVIGPQV